MAMQTSREGYLRAWARKHVHNHSCAGQRQAGSPPALIDWSCCGSLICSQQVHAWQRVKLRPGLRIFELSEPEGERKGLAQDKERCGRSPNRAFGNTSRLREFLLLLQKELG